METASSTLAWTLGVQAGVVALIAIFFLLLVRAVPLLEVRFWSVAWLCEALAIAAGFVITLWLGTTGVESGELTPATRGLLAVFASGKMLFAGFFAQGTRVHFRPGAGPMAPWLGLAAAAVSAGIVLALVVPTAVAALPVVWLVVSSLLIAAGVWGLRRRIEGRARWFALVVLAEGALFLCYVPFLVPVYWGGAPLSKVFEYSSLVDAGAALLLALATLVALDAARTQSLREANRRLRRSQASLRDLVDRDPLTGLLNRRALRRFFDDIELPAAVVFVDIDRFKRINDRHGHATGDACLLHASQVLRESFRPEDGIFRWGGDEFLVVAPGLDRASAAERIEDLRRRVWEGTGECPPYSVSAGIAVLTEDREPSEVLAAADRAMYDDKRRAGVVGAAER